MTAPGHRVLSGDGVSECFACGAVVEVVADGPTAETFARVECRPGGWGHPPYLIPYPDGSPPLVETCAAHPYAGCAIDAPGTYASGPVWRAVR